ncbi:hypothetical protein [Pontibacter pamirensis]|uniref:hypothetical protein n=1 Tax=Pontibacter pamirensis TaxID=2562824 RepID=UPI00138A3788|nr:hypothetical protein [Pontibacter pamirensis]
MGVGEEELGAHQAPRPCQLNDRIKETYDGLNSIAANNPTFTAEQVRDAYTTPEEEPEQRQGFITFAREWIKRKHSKGRHGQSIRDMPFLLPWFVGQACGRS